MNANSTSRNIMHPETSEVLLFNIKFIAVIKNSGRYSNCKVIINIKEILVYVNSKYGFIKFTYIFSISCRIFQKENKFSSCNLVASHIHQENLRLKIENRILFAIQYVILKQTHL